MPPPSRLALALLLALAPAPAALATTMVARPLDAMIRDADAVALVTTGDVVPAASRWVDGRIVTELTVTVVETLRGSLSPGARALRLPGGTVGAVTQRLAGAPVFGPRGAWIVLLRRLPDGAFTVYDLSLGQLPVTLDPRSGAPRVGPAAAAGITLLPDPRAAAVVASTGLQEVPPEGVALERFAALVRSLPR